jgi:hypothetical protein
MWCMKESMRKYVFIEEEEEMFSVILLSLFLTYKSYDRRLRIDLNDVLFYWYIIVYCHYLTDTYR